MKKYINNAFSWFKAFKWTVRIGVILTIIIVLFGISSTIKNILFPYKEVIVKEKWQVVEKPTVKYKTIIKTIPVEVIKEKEKVIEKLKFPDWVKDKEILGTVTIPPSEGKTEVGALLDSQSGKSDFIIRQLPRPFISLKPKGYVGIDYSPIHSFMLGDWKLSGEYEAGRIGDIKPFLRGEVDDKGIYRISAGLKYEF